MTLLDADTKYPSFTLRKHTSSITSLGFLKVPISTETRVITDHDSKSTLTLKPYLVSVDETGKVIIWDLTTNRPVIDFQAHKSQIMTLKQLGIDQNDKVDHSFFGLMLTHGRDHCIKFWRIFNDVGAFDVKEVYELPVNALNFSNVDVMGKYLLTPNTMNSNTFDVYDIEFISDGKIVNETRLKRVFNSVDVYELATKELKLEFKEFKIERSNDDVNRLDRFGIVMKLLWVSPNLAFIGFESGHVASVSFEFDTKKCKVESVIGEHFPDPVLSLWKDDVNQLILSASVRSEICIHDIVTGRTSVTKLEKLGKVSCIASLNDKYVLSSWNGYIKFYQLNPKKLGLEYQYSFKKPKGLIQGDLNVMGNIQSDSNELQYTKIVKPNALAITNCVDVDPSIARLLKRRDLKTLRSRFLAIGYGDGSVMMYNDFE